MDTKFPVNNLVVYDLEVYPNYFLAGFMFPTGEIYQYRLYDYDVSQVEFLRAFLRNIEQSTYNLAGFNSSRYDDPVMGQVLINPATRVAYETSYQIIVNEVAPWHFDTSVSSIDLMQVLPGRIGLKKIGVALGHERLQELPFDPHTPLEQWQMDEIDRYNINDLQITQKLIKEIQQELDIRQIMSDKYDIDVRSKGEAAIAETVLTTEYHRLTGINAKTLKDSAREAIPKDGYIMVMEPTWWHNLATLSPSVQVVKRIGEKIFQQPIKLHERYMEKGALANTLFLGDRWYAMGVGGLHSVDGPGSWVPGKDEMLVDIDVASYYPFLMITQNLYPRCWGEQFISIFERIVTTRLEAKRAGDKITANVLKIVINGTYGKTADPYSALYDPQVTANVTVRGQLALLTLIGMLTDAGGTVVSANTDGLSLMCKKTDYEYMQSLVTHWEQFTGLEMEYTEYEVINQSDVNNYIATTTNGKLKCKGKYLTPAPGKADLRHAPIHQICARAVQAYLQEGVPLEGTIKACTDIQEFVITQQIKKTYRVNWMGYEMPHMVRFYKSTAERAGPIIKTPLAEGNVGTVALSESCIPVLDFPEEFPEDIDYDWYIGKAQEWLTAITTPKQRHMNNVAAMILSKGMMPAIVDTSKKRLSRARPVIGELDFSSMSGSERIGIATGRNYHLMAKRDVDGNILDIYQVDEHYPSKTRPTVMKNEGFELLYGGNVPIDPYQVTPKPPPFNPADYYTATELSKVKP